MLFRSPYGVLYKYQPEHRNKNIVPSSLFMCVMNNHCYVINSDFKRIEKIEWVNNNHLEMVNISVSDKYKFMVKEENDEIIKVDKLEEITIHIKEQGKLKHEKNISYIISENLEDTLINMIWDNNISYIPSIYLKNGSLYSIKFNVGKLKCSIKDKNNSLDEISSVVISNSEYDIYTEIDTKFYNGLICLENMSTYSEQYLKVVETVYRSPMRKRFNTIDTRNLNLVGLDSRKAYTSDFMDIKQYPVFNIFDLYIIYNGEIIEDYNEYY